MGPGVWLSLVGVRGRKWLPGLEWGRRLKLRGAGGRDAGHNRKGDALLACCLSSPRPVLGLMGTDSHEQPNPLRAAGAFLAGPFKVAFTWCWLEGNHPLLTAP